MTRQYDAQALGVGKTLLSWRGTMLPLVLARPVFWVLLAIHAALLALANIQHVKLDANHTAIMALDDYGNPYRVMAHTFELPKMNWSAVGTVTALLTFFLVFYGSQSYGRLNTLYGHCVGLGGTLMNWVGLVKVSFPDDKDAQWNATRLILAALHIQYYTLNESSGGAAISEEEWSIIRQRSLLKQNEVALLTSYEGYKPFLPLVWALREVEHALRPADDANVRRHLHASDLLSNFRELAFAFRGHCGQITNWLKQPVPFPYFHALTVLLIVDLLLISYGLVTLGFELSMTCTIYIVICVMFLGLKDVAVQMSDPFGDDDVDFDLEPMLSGAYKNAVALLRDERAPDGGAIGDLTNPITDRTQRFTIDHQRVRVDVLRAPGADSQRRQLLKGSGGAITSDRL